MVLEGWRPPLPPDAEVAQCPRRVVRGSPIEPVYCTWLPSAFCPLTTPARTSALCASHRRYDALFIDSYVGLQSLSYGITFINRKLTLTRSGVPSSTPTYGNALSH